ncbi:MAG: methyltransferase, partial [Planctomycetota bacterium]
MSSSESSKLQQALEQLAQSIGDFGLQKLVLSQRKEDSSEIHRVEFRPVQLKTGRAYQVTSFSRTQAFHRNLSAADAVKEAVRLATDDFFGFRMTLRTEVIEVQSVRKGGVRLRKQARADVESSAGERVPCDAAIPLAHNQVKNYLIPDQTPCPFLIETGIMSKDGHVKASHMKKFRQINRFLEFINDIAASLPDDRPIRIVDFGCGKSYLTFATHY